jgi:acrylyl-CoA reductase (NADPH)
MGKMVPVLIFCFGWSDNSTRKKELAVSGKCKRFIKNFCLFAIMSRQKKNMLLFQPQKSITMDNKKFRALVTEETDDKQFTRLIKTLTISDLPEGDLLVKVYYSSLNYKDALSATGNKGVTKNYPHTPGIDAAGVVEQSGSDKFKPGDEVIVTSYDLGMNTDGGFGEYIRVPSEWALKLPEGMSLKESMIFGTAGFTAGMAIFQIMKKVVPAQGEILVTGASGGLGSLAVAILSQLGYKVTAATGKADAHDFLKKLGANKIISREELLSGKERPILKPRWSAVIDTVGGDLLANAIKSTDLQGIVACCGNAASPSLNINVFPFILRGVSLVGIDSQNCLMPRREEIWTLLATDWKPPFTNDLYHEVNLDNMNDKIDQILQGKITGRIVLKHDHK